MTAATAARVWQDGKTSRTVRQFSLAVSFALLSVAVGAVIYAVEKYLLCLERRFVENPASVMMRACGLAHFWIAWLFLFTSPKLRNRRAGLRLLVLTVFGVSLCWLCAAAGAAHNPFIFLFFYSYFLIHELRDQTYLYQSYGEAPQGAGDNQRFLSLLKLTVMVSLTGLLIASYLFHGRWIKQDPLLVSLSPWYFVVLMGCLASLTFSLARRTWHLGEREYGSLPAAVAAHRPVVMVYSTILVVLLLGAAAGSVSFNLIILIHAGAWLVFVYYQLENKAIPARHNLWTWIRYTPRGFVTLHVAAIAAALLLMALRVHLWQRVGFVSELFDGENFPYWSLMHITMAFWRAR